jgi:hypothetical protein
MNSDELLVKINHLKIENQDLKIENEDLKIENENLKNEKKNLEKYYKSRKEYYEKNKDIIKQKAKEGLKKLSQENPDKLKEYRRNAYLKRKEKMNKLNENI